MTLPTHDTLTYLYKILHTHTRTHTLPIKEVRNVVSPLSSLILQYDPVVMSLIVNGNGICGGTLVSEKY